MKQRKYLFLFAIICMLALWGSLDVNAVKADSVITTYDEKIYINPLYKDVITENDLVKPDQSANSAGGGKALGYEDMECFDDISKVAEVIRAEMVDRNETCEVAYKMDSSAEYDDDFWSNLMDEVFKHTGNPTEGDYIKWQYAGWRASVATSTNQSTGEFTVYMTLTLTYYTTYDQEKEETEKLDEVMDSLALTGKSTYGKIVSIYDYICSNVVYDHTNLNDSSYKLKYTSYAALINGTSVCQGYAVLLYRMLLTENIDARFISGDGNGRHGWNIACIGDKYYNLDSTWDAGKNINTYKYFLLSNDDFLSHTRDDEYSTDEFNAIYPMASVSYNATHTHVAGEPVRENEVAASCSKEGSYDSVIYCSVCGTEMTRITETIAKSAHKAMTDASVAATCTSTGLTEGSHCSVCGTVIKAQEVIQATGHSMTYTAAVAATEETEGNLAYYTCSNCNKKFSDKEGTKELSDSEIIIAKLSHKHTLVKTAAKAASCTEAGNKAYYTCSGCKKVFADENATVETSVAAMTIAATGHTVVTDAAVAATCIATGLTEGSHCSVCGEVIKAQEITDKKDHDWNTDYTVDVEATATTAGSKSIHCKNCNETKDSQVIPATGETSGEQTPSSPAVISKQANVITASDIVRTWSTAPQYFTVGASCYGGAALSYSSDNGNIAVNASGTVTVSAGYIGTGRIYIFSAETGNYNAASAVITVTVGPTGSSLKSAKNSSSKKMTVKWTKNKTVNGYLIQYSTDSNFSSNVRSKIVTKNKTTSVKIGGLKKKSVYYVRICTYKSIGGVKYYSTWSNVKKVTIKK